MENPKIAAMIAGAGYGRRMGKNQHKMLIEIEGLKVREWTLRALKKAEAIDAYILVLRAEDMAYVREILCPSVFDPEDQVLFVQGGKERSDSVKAGLQALPQDTDYVLIHDGARPFVSPGLIHRAMDRLLQGDVEGVIAAMPCKDSMKAVSEDGLIQKALDRRTLYQAQTPQIFRKDTLLEAYSKVRPGQTDLTDDAQIVAAIGGRVAIVPGEETNIKITTPDDLTLGQMILKDRRETVRKSLKAEMR